MLPLCLSRTLISEARSHWVLVRCEDRCLTLSGKLPSYYLKQLAQEALRNLVGIDRIENRIGVASPVGEVKPCEQSGIVATDNSPIFTSNKKPR